MRGNLRRSFSFQDEDNIHARNSNDVVTRRSSKVEGIFPDTARFKRKRKRKQSSTHFWPRLYEKKERKIRKALDYESIDKKKNRPEISPSHSGPGCTPHTNAESKGRPWRAVYEEGVHTSSRPCPRGYLTQPDAHRYRVSAN